MMRRQARKDLGERGIIATESELNKWKLEQLDSLKNRSSVDEPGAGASI